MKILVNVSVPAIMQNFDVMIPESLYISDAAGMIAEAVAEKTNHEYLPSGEEVLCLKRDNTVLDRNLYVDQCGVMNGDTLVMI